MRLSHAEPLAEQVLVWQATVERLNAQGAELRRRDKGIVDQRLAVATAKEKLGQAERDRRTTLEAIGPSEARAEEAEAALSALVGAAPDPQVARRALEARRDQLQTETRRLDLLATPMERLHSSAAALLQLEAERASAEAEQGTLQARLPDLDALEGAHAVAAGSANEALVARKLILELASRRDALRKGVPCPLCGGLEHPWQGQPLDADAHALVGAAEQSLKLAEKTLQETRRQRSIAIVQVERLGVLLGRLAPRLASQKLSFQEASRVLDLELRAADLRAAHLPLRADEVRPGEVEALCTEARQLIEERRGEQNLALADVNEALTRLDEAVAAAQTAARLLATARETWGQQERAILAANGELQRAEDALAYEDQARAELAARFDDERRALHAALDVAGLHAADGELKVGVAAAAKLVADWRKANLSEQAAREALNAAEIAVAATQRGVEASERTAQEARLRADERREQAVSAAAAASQVLNGQDPDATERALEDARAQADATKKAAAEALEATRLHRSQLAGQRANAQTQRDALTTRLGASREALAAAVATLGLPDRAALAARVLGPDVVNALAARERTLQNDLTEANARCQDARGALAVHKNARPEAAPVDEDGLAKARLDLATLDEQRTARLQRRGALRERLTIHEQNLARLGALRGELEVAVQELDVWDRINSLIGANNGEAFKKYAQILNLEDLLQRANQRLQWLAPRYLLVPAKGPNGEERLAFAVQDEHQAWEARPLTTLSGGETFLVSLSLALALAEYRTLQAPIETLLLDEGFGTLDTDTLNTVMDALERLQTRGARIGLISHVDGLRERIEARVAVEAIGHGRSRLRVELGSGAAALRLA